ncbi:hypothetical protein [Paludisphaera borealis]|uniref:Uncharacterized protein n=1 Tax=Paludisphaera borealis TaxID=1387353 RepID=A0A1U7CMG8_9BACT|nr:hypothetical protein [Paludisphaera borealis]APW60144.1 hypothetical protein BSF38_01610 [Paludisphaera borealis]MDR3621430.1 hypothetical protein [Paludisphaera borealis]
MLPRIQKPALRTLDLPPEFEDLTGVINSDVKVIVSILAERASERLLLSKRQTQQLQRSLWNSLAETINDKIKVLSVDRR